MSGTTSVHTGSDQLRRLIFWGWTSTRFSITREKERSGILSRLAVSILCHCTICCGSKKIGWDVAADREPQTTSDQWSLQPKAGSEKPPDFWGFWLVSSACLLHTADMITMIADTHVTKREAAELLGLALSTVHSLCSRGTIRTEPTRFGRLIPQAEIDRYKAEHLNKRGRKSTS